MAAGVRKDLENHKKYFFKLVIYAYKTMKLIEWVYITYPKKTVFFQKKGRKKYSLYDHAIMKVNYVAKCMTGTGSVEW
jgi:hypothetical protein